MLSTRRRLRFDVFVIGGREENVVRTLWLLRSQQKDVQGTYLALNCPSLMPSLCIYVNLINNINAYEVYCINIKYGWQGVQKGIYCIDAKLSQR